MSATKQLLFASSLGQGTLFLESTPFTASATASSIFGNLTIASLRLNVLNNGQLNVTRRIVSQSTGDVSTVIKSYDWLTGGSASIYGIRVRRLTGNLFNLGSALIDSWLPMDTDRSWFLESTSVAFSGFDSRDISFVIELALFSNVATILESTNMTFSPVAAFSGTPPIFF